MGFTKCKTDPNLYFILVGSNPLILVLYMDDLFLTGGKELIARCNINLATKFEMKDINLMHYFLGLKVRKKSREIFLGQGKYIVEILKRFEMENYPPMATPIVSNLKNIDSSELRVGGSQSIQKIDRFLDLFDQN